MSSNVFPYTHPSEAIPRVNPNGRMSEISKAIQSQLDSLIAGLGIVDNSIALDTALGTSIDALGELFKERRLTNDTDETYRSRLSTIVVDTTYLTEDLIISIIEDVTDWTPTLDEGAGTVDIDIPFNKLSLADEMMVQIDRVKAAGIAFTLNYDSTMWFESFDEPVITVEDLLWGVIYPAWEDTIADFPKYQTIGWDASVWDVGNWDDARDYPSDIFAGYFGLSWEELLDTSGYTDEILVGLLQYLTESILESALTDEIGGIIAGLLVESLSIDTQNWIELSGIISGLFTESYTIGTTWDDISGIIAGMFTESYDASLTDDLSGIIASSFIESYHGSGWDKGEWDVTRWDSDIGYYDFDIFIGRSFIESFTIDTDWDVFSGIISGLLSEDYDASLTDDLTGIIKGLLIESLAVDVANWIEMSGILSGLLTESYTIDVSWAVLSEFLINWDETYDPSATDDLTGTIEGMLTESLSVDTANWIESSGTISAQFVDALSKRTLYKIGTAKIGTAKIGIGRFTKTTTHEWDSGYWDAAYWDNGDGDIVVEIEEGF